MCDDYGPRLYNLWIDKMTLGLLDSSRREGMCAFWRTKGVGTYGLIGPPKFFLITYKDEKRSNVVLLWLAPQTYMHSDVPAATWLVTPPLGMMNNLNVAIISTKLYFPFGGKWTGQGVFRQASTRSKMRNRPIYHDKMDSRSPWSIITNICYSYTICTE